MRNFFICTFFLAFASAATLINVSLNTIQNEWIWSGNCSGGSVWFNGAATLTNRPVLYSTREFDAANGKELLNFCLRKRLWISNRRKMEIYECR